MKGPNLASTCNEEVCTTKSSKHIYNQYPVTLYQGVAVPGHWTGIDAEGVTGSDFAARYAMGVGKRTIKKS